MGENFPYVVGVYFPILVIPGVAVTSSQSFAKQLTIEDNSPELNPGLKLPLEDGFGDPVPPCDPGYKHLPPLFY